MTAEYRGAIPAKLEPALLARQGRWKHGELFFLCPEHDDHHPSARWNPSKQAWYCDPCGKGGGWQDLAERLSVEPESLDGQTPKQRVIVATYDYRAGTELLYETVRFSPKDFRQRRPDGRGGWIWNLQGVRRVLYRWPELLAADPNAMVHLPEGERDVDRLASLGRVATTNVGGSGKWKTEYAECLRGRHVVILPDNDDAGRKHAEQVARSLYGVAASVRVLALPGLPDKGDVSDWLDDSHTSAELDRLVAEAPILDSRFPYVANRENRENRASGRFALTTLEALLAEPQEEIEYIVEDMLPAGGVSMLAAKPKVGKTTLARNLAVAQARGDLFLGRATAKGPVVYLALEEKRSQVAKHFARMGASNEPIYVHVGSAPEEALEALRAAIAEHAPVLAIVDPVFKLVRIRDGNDYAADRARPIDGLSHPVCPPHVQGRAQWRGRDPRLDCPVRRRRHGAADEATGRGPHHRDGPALRGRSARDRRRPR